MNSKDSSHGHQRTARGGRVSVMAAGFLGALLLAACGGSAGSAGGQAADSSYYGHALAYAQCMRTHGQPNFPDPNSNGGFILTGRYVDGHLVSGVDPNSPQYQTAQKSCEKLLPKNPQKTAGHFAQQLQDALKYSACMRAHGIPNFPDPTVTNGTISLNYSPTAGQGPNSPQYQAAQQVCQPLMGLGGK
jgi:hypothetical protein